MGEVEKGSKVKGVKVLRVDDGGSRLENVSANGHSGHTAAGMATSLEDVDVVEALGAGWARACVVFDEMRERGSSDAAADHADARRRSRDRGGDREKERSEDQEEESLRSHGYASVHRHLMAIVD